MLFQLTDHTGMNPIKLVVRLTETEDQVELAEHDLNLRAQTFQFQLPTDPWRNFCPRFCRICGPWTRRGGPWPEAMNTL